MSNRDISLAMKLYADATRFVSGLVNAETGVRKFTSSAKREFDALRNSLNTIEGKVAGLGITYGVTASIIQSAKMDKSLTQIGQTAGATENEVASLRKELFKMSQETGANLDELQGGFNNAVQSGLNFKEALPVIDATNKAVAVTSASADALTSSLTVASTAYNFDLTKPNMALGILDRMTVAGRLGNAELGNLSDIFARVGPSSAAAGLGFDKTLAFIEGLSMVERQPERLATLADSTLRLFTNMRYMKDAQKASGIKFFDKDGNRRDAIAVLDDFKKQYDTFTNDKQRSTFIQKAFGKADLDTQKGMRILLNGDTLTKIKQFSTDISKAGGTLNKDLSKAISNAVDQTGRLKSQLRDAADSFAQPINDAYQNIVKYALDKKSNGGLGLNGKDLLVGGGAAIGGTLLAARYGGMAIKSLAGKFGNVASGVATGKALETAAGVTPVYVVNMPGEGLGAAGLPAGAAAKAGRLAGFAKYAGGVGLAGAAGYGVGTVLNKGINLADEKLGTGIGNIIGRSVAIALAPFSATARDALRSEFNTKLKEFQGTLNIKVDSEGRIVNVAKTTNSKVDINVSTGRYMVTQ